MQQQMDSKIATVVCVALICGLGSITAMTSCEKDRARLEAQTLSNCIEKTQKPLECKIAIKGSRL